MGCPTNAILTKTLTFTLTGKSTTGIPVDTDSLPTYSIYENETGTAINTGTMAKLDDAGTTGLYSEQLSLTAANGYEAYKTYTIHIEAEIDSVAVQKLFTFFVLDAATASSMTETSDGLTTLANVKEFLGITSTDYDSLLSNLIVRATYSIEKFCQRVLRSDDYRQFYDGDGSDELVLINYPVTEVQLMAENRQAGFCISNTSTDAYHAMVSVTGTTIRLLVQGGDNADDTSLTLADYSTLTSLLSAITSIDKGWVMINNTALGVWSPSELIPSLGGSQCLGDYADVYIPDEPLTDFVVDNESGIINLRGRFCHGFQNIIIRYTAGYTTIPADLEQVCIDLVKIYYDMRDKNWLLSSEKIGDYSYGTKADQATCSNMPKHITDRLEIWKAHRL